MISKVFVVQRPKKKDWQQLFFRHTPQINEKPSNHVSQVEQTLVIVCLILTRGTRLFSQNLVFFQGTLLFQCVSNENLGWMPHWMSIYNLLWQWERDNSYHFASGQASCERKKGKTRLSIHFVFVSRSVSFWAMRQRIVTLLCVQK